MSRFVLIPQLRFKNSVSLTSDIRFAKNGLLKQIALNQILKVKYFWSQFSKSSSSKIKGARIYTGNNDTFLQMNRMYERGLKLNNVN